MPQRGAELSRPSDASRDDDLAAMEDRVNVETRRKVTESAEVVNTTRARQGVTGHNVRYVLAVGIVGVVILFVLASLAVR